MVVGYIWKTVSLHILLTSGLSTLLTCTLGCQETFFQQPQTTGTDRRDRLSGMVAILPLAPLLCHRNIWPARLLLHYYQVYFTRECTQGWPLNLLCLPASSSRELDLQAGTHSWLFWQRLWCGPGFTSSSSLSLAVYLWLLYLFSPLSTLISSF